MPHQAVGVQLALELADTCFEEQSVDLEQGRQAAADTAWARPFAVVCLEVLPAQSLSVPRVEVDIAMAAAVAAAVGVVAVALQPVRI